MAHVWSESGQWNRKTLRRLARISAYSLMSVLAVLLVLAVAAYVRLAQRPGSLGCLRGTVESKINQAMEQPGESPLDYLRYLARQLSVVCKHLQL